MDIHRVVRQFFEDYAAILNRALGDPPIVDVESAAAFFAEHFIGATPLGVYCGANDESLRQVIPQGYAFYKSIGTHSMTVAALEVTPLDDLHVMARVHWDSRYRLPKSHEQQIEFDVIYLLQLREGKPLIFAYITGDEQKVLREHGLIPG